MIGDRGREWRDWLAGFSPPSGALPLAAETEAANRRMLRRGWVDVTYVSELEPPAALDALAAARRRARFAGVEGRFALRLTHWPRFLPIGLVATGRVRAYGDGSLVEAQMGRPGGGLGLVVIPALALFALVVAGIQALAHLPFTAILPFGTAATAVLFVAARLAAPSGRIGRRYLHSRVPPAPVQPIAVPVCGPDPRSAQAEVRRALRLALTPPVEVELTTRLSPVEVRDALREHVGGPRSAYGGASRVDAPLLGKVTERRIDVVVHERDGRELLRSPHLEGRIEARHGGSLLLVRKGQSSLAAKGMLVVAALSGLGALGMLTAALALGEAGLAVGGAFVGVMAASFAGGVLAVGWEADELEDPVEMVRLAIDGTVRGSGSPSSWAPPPSLVDPDRR